MTLEERKVFDDWRADPRHQTALNRMHELWGETAALKDANLPLRAPRKRIALPVAIAASVALMVAASAYWVTIPKAAPLTTGIGEQRSLALSDGSVIALNVVSRARFTPTPLARRVVLEEGEAEFIVHKDETRPFTVTTGKFEVRAIGTTFNVLSRSGNLDVAVKEGLVEVRQLDGMAKPVRLRAGQRLTLKAGQVLDGSKSQTIDTRAVAEWRQRVLSYEDAPVATVVADLNRFFERPLDVSSPIAANRVTIRLVVNDRAETLKHLSGILSADIKSTENADTLVPAPPK